MSSRGSDFDASDPDTGGRVKRRKSGKKARPLDETTLRDLALAYVARFSTTGSKLEQYLARKIRERGVAEDGDGRQVELDVSALVARFVELGYIDDGVYAASKSRDLTARGYGARRVEQALWAAGVDEGTRETHAPGEAESRRAAVLLAKKRRFGPFGRGEMDDAQEADPLEQRKTREKQVAAMLRAGHSYDAVAFIMDASSAAIVDEWLNEAEDAENAQG